MVWPFIAFDLQGVLFQEMLLLQIITACSIQSTIKNPMSVMYIKVFLSLHLLMLLP